MAQTQHEKELVDNMPQPNLVQRLHAAGYGSLTNTNKLLGEFTTPRSDFDDSMAKKLFDNFFNTMGPHIEAVQSQRTKVA